MSALLEGSRIALEAWVMATQQLLLEGGRAARPCGSGMVLRQGVAGIALADEPGMRGDLAAAPTDHDVGRILVDGDRLPDEALGHGVAVGIDRHIAVQIDDALQRLVDRRQCAGQRLQVRLLDQISCVGGHAQRTLRLVVGDIAAPGQCLAVDIREVVEAARRQEVAFHIGERPLDPPFAIGVADPVGAEAKAQRAGKGVHLGGDDGIRTGAGGDHDAGVVDDTDRAAAVHEARRLEQEVLGLEAGEAWIVLNEQPAREGQHQPGALRGDRLAGHHHAVRRGVVLHLLAGGEVILARALRWTAQSCLSDPARQGAVGNRQIVLRGEQLLHARHVAACTRKGVLEPGQRRRLAGGRRGRLAVAQDAAHRIT